MTTVEMLSLALSALTIFLSAIAVFVSVFQIRNQNRLSLLNKRLDCLLKTRCLIEPIQQNNGLIKQYLKDMGDGPILAADFLFNLLTNSDYLECLQGTLEHTLESDSQNRLLKKAEELRKLAETINAIFPKKTASPLSDLAQINAVLFISLYKYQVCINGLEKEAKVFPMRAFDKVEAESLAEKSARTDVASWLKKADDQVGFIASHGLIKRAFDAASIK